MYIDDPGSLRLGHSAVEAATREVRASLERLLAGNVALEDSDDESVGRSDGEASPPVGEEYPEGTGTSWLTDLDTNNNRQSG